MGCECSALEFAQFQDLPVIGGCPPPVPPGKIWRALRASIGWSGWYFDVSKPQGYTTKLVEWTDGNGSHTARDILSRASEGGVSRVEGDVAAYTEQGFRTDWELISQSSTQRVYRGGEFARSDRKTETLVDVYDPASDLGALISAASGFMGTVDEPSSIPSRNETYHAAYERGTGRIVIDQPGSPVDLATMQLGAADGFEVCQCDAFQYKRNFGGGNITVVWQAAEVWITAPWYLRTYAALTRFDADGFTKVRNICCQGASAGFPEHTFCGDIVPECERRSDDSINGRAKYVTLSPGDFNGTGYLAQAGGPPCNLAP